MGDTKTGNPTRANALVPEERDLLAFLRAQHLPGVDADDEAGVALEIEQARLVLFGAGGLVLVISTQILDVTSAACVRPLYLAVPLLLIALLICWFNLIAAAKLRRIRVERRYDMLFRELGFYLSGLREMNDLDLNMMNKAWDEVIGPENAFRYKLSVTRNLAFALAALGVVCAVWAAFATAQPQFCPGGRTIIGLTNSPPIIEGIAQP